MPRIALQITRVSSPHGASSTTKSWPILMTAVGLVAGCSQVLGFKDPQLKEVPPVDAASSADATPDSPPARLDCPSYCAEIMTNCTGTNAQYSAMGNCLGACAAFPAGTLADISGNTLGCRLYHSGAPSMMTPTTHCIHAGPGGDQTTRAGVCGDTCSSFCAIEIKACGTVDAPLTGITPPYQNAAACLSACGNFDKTHLYVLNGTPTTPAGDSLACRLYHVTNAASFAMAVPPNVPSQQAHCGHTAATPTGPCTGTPAP